MKLYGEDGRLILRWCTRLRWMQSCQSDGEDVSTLEHRGPVAQQQAEWRPCEVAEVVGGTVTCDSKRSPTVDFSWNLQQAVLRHPLQSRYTSYIDAQACFLRAPQNTVDLPSSKGSCTDSRLAQLPHHDVGSPVSLGRHELDGRVNQRADQSKVEEK